MYGQVGRTVTGLGMDVGGGLEEVCCPLKEIRGNQNPNLNGMYSNVGKQSGDTFPKTCRSPCVYVKKDSTDSIRYCFADSTYSKSRCVRVPPKKCLPATIMLKCDVDCTLSALYPTINNQTFTSTQLPNGSFVS